MNESDPPRPGLADCAAPTRRLQMGPRSGQDRLATVGFHRFDPVAEFSGVSGHQSGASRSGRGDHLSRPAAAPTVYGQQPRRDQGFVCPFEPVENGFFQVSSFTAPGVGAGTGVERHAGGQSRCRESAGASAALHKGRAPFTVLAASAGPSSRAPPPDALLQLAAGSAGHRPRTLP